MKERHGFYPLFIATILVITFFAENVIAKDIAEGLVLYLPFEDGKNPADRSAKPAKLAIRGNLKSAAGKFGQALEFDGKGANVVEVAHADKLEGMGALTIAAWAKPRKPAGQDGMSIASKRVGFELGDVYNLFIWTGQTMRARVNGKGEIASNTVFKDGIWYHVAYVFDGKAGGNERVKLYVDGVLDGSGSHPETAVGEGDAPLWIGELNDGRNFAWNGAIDEVGIWARALSEQEIESVMNDGLEKLLAVKPQGKLTTTWSEIKRSVN